MSNDTGIIEIHGKSYYTVAKRLRTFWDKHPDWTITTKILNSADLITIRATIKDETGRIRATGTAEEERGSTNINKTSAMENCETSAIGRCLGVYGMGGTHIASAEEMERALEQQKDMAVAERLIAHNKTLVEHFDSIACIKSLLIVDDYEAAYEALAEIPEDDRKALWVAPTKGGVWTTREREQMKSDEMSQARKNYHGEAV